MAFKMGGWSAFTKKDRIEKLKQVEEELRGAVKAHGKQADIVEAQDDHMESKSPLAKAKGIDGIPCWKGYGIPKEGPKTKMKGGKQVDNCKTL